MSHKDWGSSNNYAPRRIEKANAIVSAFAKANKTVVGNKIKMEVFKNICQRITNTPMK